MSIVRRIYPADDDPAALCVEISPAGISALPDVAIIATDNPKYGDERERPVRIIMSSTQAADLTRRLRALLEEI